MVGIQQVSPSSVAQGRRSLGRADDVAEEDGGEHSVGLGGRGRTGQEFGHCVEGLLSPLGEEPGIGPRYLHEPRSGDVLGEVLTMFQGDQREVGPVEHQGGDADRRENGAYV